MLGMITGMSGTITGMLGTITGMLGTVTGMLGTIRDVSHRLVMPEERDGVHVGTFRRHLGGI